MRPAGRPTVAIELTEDERATLQRWARRHSSSQALALRSRIVLAVAEGGFLVRFTAAASRLLAQTRQMVAG